MKKSISILVLFSLLLISFSSCQLINENSKTSSDIVIVAQGIAGDNISWKIDTSHTLTFSGIGVMNEYYQGDWYQPSVQVIPWHAYNGYVEQVVIESGITSICRFAFINFYNCSIFDIPNTVQTIGSCAFEYSGVKNLSFWPESVTTISSYSFKGCHKFDQEVNIPAFITNIESDAFYRESASLYVENDTIFYVPSTCYIQNNAFSGWTFVVTSN